MAKPIVLILTCCSIAPTIADDRPTAGRLGERIEAILAPIGDGPTVAVAFRDLESGEQCLIRADLPFHPASTMKVPAMLEVDRQEAVRKLRLDDRLRVRNEFASLVDGSPYALDPADDSELTLYHRAGLPPGVPVAHKTGSFQGVYHDAAVVEVPGRKPFVLVVLTRGIVDEPAAHKLDAEIARAAHDQATHR